MRPRLAARAAEDDQVPPGCSRYSVEVNRPLGLILEERNGAIVVAEVVKGEFAFFAAASARCSPVVSHWE